MLQDRVIIVTGASRGIGRAAVAALAQRGATVVAVARGLGPEQPRPPGAALTMAVDVRDQGQMQRLLQRVSDDYQRVDGLVNNAGIMVGDLNFTELTPELWREILDTNLGGAFLGCWASIPYMLQQGFGTIINITSGAAVRTGFLNIAYGVSKAGLDRLTLGLGAELKERGIACISLSPPVTATATVRQMYPGKAVENWAHPPELTAQALCTLLENEPLDYAGQVLSVKEYLQQKGLLTEKPS